MKRVALKPLPIDQKLSTSPGLRPARQTRFAVSQRFRANPVGVRLVVLVVDETKVLAQMRIAELGA